MPHPGGIGLGASQLATIFVAVLIVYWFTHRAG